MERVAGSRTRLEGTPQPQLRIPVGGGLKLAADCWGDPGGRLVLLQHGGGQTRHAWKGTGEALGGAGFHAVAFDARGHGDSDWDPDADYAPGRLVADLAAVSGYFGDPRPVLVGASMGGGTSLLAVGEGVLDPAALILVDVAPKVEPSGVENIRAFMYGHPDGFASLQEVAAAIAAYQPHRKAPGDLRGLAKNVRLGDDGRFYWHWDPAFPFNSPNIEAREALFEACARRIAQPTLLVRGALSDVLSEAGVAAFRAVCPHAEYVSVKDAAHMVAGDRNDVFGTVVADFLRRHISPTAETAPPTEAEADRLRGTLPIEGADDIIDIP